MTHHQHSQQSQSHRQPGEQYGQSSQQYGQGGQQYGQGGQQPQQTRGPPRQGGQSGGQGRQGGQRGLYGETHQPAQERIGRERIVPPFETANFLDDQVRATSVQTLNQVLADLTVVVSQVKGAHWNVRGPDFYQLHELFEDVADSLEPHVDEVAERVTALGGTARGTVVQAAQETTLPPMPDHLVTGPDLLQHVAQTLSALDATLYQGMESIEQRGDLDTVDLLNEVSRDVSKAMWFVEAHLQGTQQGQRLQSPQ